MPHSICTMLEGKVMTCTGTSVDEIPSLRPSLPKDPSPHAHRELSPAARV